MGSPPPATSKLACDAHNRYLEIFNANWIPSDQNVSRVRATPNAPDQDLSRYTVELGDEKGNLVFFTP